MKEPGLQWQDLAAPCLIQPQLWYTSQASAAVAPPQYLYLLLELGLQNVMLLLELSHAHIRVLLVLLKCSQLRHVLCL